MEGSFIVINFSINSVTPRYNNSVNFKKRTLSKIKTQVVNNEILNQKGDNSILKKVLNVIEKCKRVFKNDSGIDISKVGQSVLKKEIEQSAQKLLSKSGGVTKPLKTVNTGKPKLKKAVNNSSVGVNSVTKTLVNNKMLIPKKNYRPDGTLDSITEFNPKNGNKLKETFFHDDGKTLDYVTEYHNETGGKLSDTCYQRGGKVLKYKDEYDPHTGKLVKETCYGDDGKKIKFIYEYDRITGKNIKNTRF